MIDEEHSADAGVQRIYDLTLSYLELTHGLTHGNSLNLEFWLSSVLAILRLNCDKPVRSRERNQNTQVACN